LLDGYLGARVNQGQVSMYPYTIHFRFQVWIKFPVD